MNSKDFTIDQKIRIANFILDNVDANGLSDNIYLQFLKHEISISIEENMHYDGHIILRQILNYFDLYENEFINGKGLTVWRIRKISIYIIYFLLYDEFRNNHIIPKNSINKIHSITGLNKQYLLAMLNKSISLMSTDNEFASEVIFILNKLVTGMNRFIIK